MKLKSFATTLDNYKNYSDLSDLEHFFNIYYDKMHKVFRFNLNSTVYVNVFDDMCLHITLHADLHWSIISYNIYGTTRLAWLLMKLNNVRSENVFNLVRAGTIVRFIPYENVQEIIKSYY